MYRTPKNNKKDLVLTRKMAKRAAEENTLKEDVAQEGDLKLEQPQILPQTQPEKLAAAAPASLPGMQGTKSKASIASSSSITARKRRLELEAAQAKARIEVELIDKRLQADLADLEDEECNISPHSLAITNGEIEKWLDDSHQLLNVQSAPNKCMNSGGPCTSRLVAPEDSQLGPSVAPVDRNDTVQMLASALRDLATAKYNNTNTHLLSRMSTPRDLPTFTGEPMEWLQFKHAYDESSQICNFSQQENLWRLRKCLHGAAKEAVAALLMSAAGPEKVMSTLELRFGNPDIILYRIMDDIRKLPTMSLDYHKEIVVFSVKVQNFIAAVRAVGRDEYLHGMNIASLIISKFPTVLLSRWSDYSYPRITESKQLLLDVLSEFLNEEAIKLTTTASMGAELSVYSEKPNNVSSPFTVLVQSDQNECSFCRVGKHMLSECRKFKKALRKDRWSHVNKCGVCYKCLVSRHKRETCKGPVCDVDNCGGSHHRLLHFVPRERETKPAVQTNSGAGSSMPQPPSSTNPEPAVQTVAHVDTDNWKVLLKVVPVRIHGPNGVIQTCALLDDGSTISLMSEELALRAGLQGSPDTVRVRGAWTDNELVFKSNIVNVNISGIGINSQIYSLTVRSCKQLNLPKQNISVDVNIYDHLKFLNENNCYKYLCNSNTKPLLLIGQDNYHLLQPIECSLGKRLEPSATLTPLGWCVHGIVPSHLSRYAPYVSLLVNHERSDDSRELHEIHEEVRRSFSIDALGVSSKARINVEEDSARRQLEQSAVLKDGRWSVSLPWKDRNCVMPDSYNTALNRLKNIERKMNVNNEFAIRYKDRINHLFENNYARQSTHCTPTSSRSWYLPHFGVDNPNKKKLRLVFDAASKTKGMSLNDYLLTGQDLLISLLGIMFRFREYRVAITGDIRDMFLQIKINNEDQDSLRFLWRENPGEKVQVYKMNSLIFGANCSPFIAQFIKNKNAERYESSLPAAVNAIRTQHYMDDYIDSINDVDYTIQMVRNIRYIHQSGGFEIRNWACNSSTVLASIPQSTLAASAIRFNLEQQGEGERTLGLNWYPVDDVLGFDLSLKRIPNDVLEGKQRPTKRLLLRVVMSIFDIFGFLSPFTIQGKIMLQDTWRSNVGWDEIVTNEIFEKWSQWIVLLQTIDKVRIPRCYLSMCERIGNEMVSLTSPPLVDGMSTNVDYTGLQLHLFCDASMKAMCAVAYWRWYDVNYRKIVVSFVASKCRVAPVKPTTVPRLELQAAVLAARLADTIQTEHRLKVCNRYFWCDSSVVLHWIKNDARNYNTFVSNRLGEIDDLTRINEWHYIHTKLNVADLATRDKFDHSVFMNEWFYGPSFLSGDESQWPQQDVICTGERNIELIASVQHSNHKLVPVPESSRFSSWLRLKRTTAIVLKFIYRCRRKLVDISCELLDEAERLLIKHSQWKSFGEELSALSNGKCIGRTSRLLTLSPYIDEHGLLRCGGRIDVTLGVSNEMKRPLILDGKHHITRLIVRHYHVKFAHVNQEAVVNELRQRYWVIKLRPTVRSIASQCMLCRLRKCKPQVPRMGDLPEGRVAHHFRPFSHCGLDLFGPMEAAVGRRREKRYGVIFTCLTIRAVHMEIVNSLTTDSLIMALRRMAARRGWPRCLYSDNGTNLRGADVELQRSMKCLDQDALKLEGMNNDMEWKFIPPSSPHWGGAWERLVRSVKTSLNIILKERAPRDEVLATLMAEVENMVNGRPLTHVSVDPGASEALTPNHFLLGSSSNLPVIGAYDEREFDLRKQWRKAQYLSDMYWRRWVKEVLPELIPRRKWNEDQARQLQVGDLVYIVDPSVPRNVWLKGLIHKVFPGKDGRVRLVEVRTGSGVFKRPAARVAYVPIGD